MAGNRPRVLEPDRAFIAERIEQVPSLTLYKLKAELDENVSISRDAIWRYQRHENYA
jgi:putative transposase